MTYWHCRWCGSEIEGDDSGGWLHVWTRDPHCVTPVAEPDPAEMAS